MTRKVRIGTWLADEASDTLVADGARAKVERRAMATLLLLAGRAGEVVSRDEILAAVWPGLHVSDHSVAIVISDLRRALGDDKAAPRFIETIPKRGYRLVASVAAEEPARPLAFARRSALAVILLGMLGTTAAGLWAFGSQRGRPELPIYVRDLAASPDDPVAFALGDMISSTLAQGGARTVIRWRADSALVPRREGRLVTGRSIAQGANRLVLLQVSDAATGELMWAGNYVVAPGRLAARALQASRDVARALGLAPPGAAIARLEPEAYERYWRARHLWDRRETGTIRAACRILEQLVEDEPGFALAHAALAEIYAHKSGEELAIPRVDTFAAARRHLAAARALAPPTSEILTTEAVLSFYADRDLVAARRAAARAVELAPGRPAPWQTLAMVESAAGNADASIAAIEQARALDPGSGSIAWDRAWHLLIAGRGRAALPAVDEARRAGQNVTLLTALASDAAGAPDRAFAAWLARAGEAGVGPGELAAIHALPDRTAAYGRLASAFERAARPPRPVVAALLLVRGGRPGEAAQRLRLAAQRRDDWMAAWAPRMRDFAPLRARFASR